MTTADLHPLHKQLGNRILECTNGMVNGYNILTYRGVMPDEIEFVGAIKNEADKVLSFDTAYDRIFGRPIKPDFTNVIA